MRLSDFKALSFDCYGTLIDWETGVIQALRPLLARHGVAPSNDEIVAAFDNVERVLATAGATWRDVVSVNSYHVLPPGAEEIGEAHNDVMIDQFRKRMGERAPIWTETGVTVLGATGMHIEIQVTAIVGSGE